MPPAAAQTKNENFSNSNKNVTIQQGKLQSMEYEKGY
jgi:hypothetical protein